MVDSRITDLPSVIAPAITDALVVVNAGVTKQVTIEDVADATRGLAQVLTNKTMNDPTNTIHADAVHTIVRNVSGSILVSGSPVYASGYNSGLDLVEVGKADAGDPTMMPAIGIVDGNIANNASGHVISTGVMNSIDTSSWSVGDSLYVSATAGALTNTRPIGIGELVQIIAKVIRSHASAGRIIVQGAGRSNAIPNDVSVENLLDNSGFGVWSNSTLENVGSALIVNGGFDSDTSSWVDFNATLTSIAGGQAGNCLEITRVSGSAQSANQLITTTVGKLYKITGYVKSGTSGDEPYEIRDAAGNALVSGITSGSWVAWEIVREADSDLTTLKLVKESSTAGTMLFDTIVFYEVTPGCVAADTKGPDGWYKVSGGAVSRTYFGSTTKNGSVYALKLTSSGSVNQDLTWPLSDIRNTRDFTTKFNGRTVTMGAWVLTDAAGQVKINVREEPTNNFSNANVGTAWEWLEKTYTFGANPAFIMFGFWVANAKTVYISQPMLVFGSHIGEGNYSPKPSEVIWFENRKILTGYSNVTISANAAINLEAQSDGAIPKGIKAIYAVIQGESVSVEKYLRLNKDSSVAEYGIIVFSQVANTIMSVGGWQACDLNGDVYLSRNDTFNNAQINIVGIQL